MHRFRVWGLALGLAACLAAGARQARSDVILVPGDTNKPFAVQGTAPFGIVLATSTQNSQILTGVTLNTAVYRDTGSGFTTDFAFQLVNNSTATVTAVTLSNYAFSTPPVPYTTSVGALTTAPAGFPGGASGTVPPINATRDALGDLVSFSWGSSGLAPVQTSDVFFIRTNSPTFDNNSGALIDANQGGNGVSGVVINVLEPVGAVPEPSTALTAGTGLLLVLGAWLRRRT
jgi:hypothetical protein